MLPLELYPSDSAKKRGLIGVAALFFLAYQAMVWSRGGGHPTLMWVFLGLGLAGLVPLGRNYLFPRPSFAADAHGFSVMGKTKRGWDQFRGAHVRTIRYGIVPISKTVVIAVGKSVIGRRIQIHPMHLSGSADEMAAEIQAYAQAAKMRAENACSDVPVMEKHEPKPAMAPATTMASVAPQRPRSFEDRLRDGGPISSTPRFSERIFGRRKVI